MPRPKKPTIETVLEKGKALFAFPVLNRGKSDDTSGAIYEMPNGERYIILTNHGELYVGRPGELLNKLKEYEDTLDMTELALALYYKENSSDKTH